MNPYGIPDHAWIFGIPLAAVVIYTILGAWHWVLNTVVNVQGRLARRREMRR